MKKRGSVLRESTVGRKNCTCRGTEVHAVVREGKEQCLKLGVRSGKGRSQQCEPEPRLKVLRTKLDL